MTLEVDWESAEGFEHWLDMFMEAQTWRKWAALFCTSWRLCTVSTYQGSNFYVECITFPVQGSVGYNFLHNLCCSSAPFKLSHPSSQLRVMLSLNYVTLLTSSGPQSIPSTFTLRDLLPFKITPKGKMRWLIPVSPQSRVEHWCFPCDNDFHCPEGTLSQCTNYTIIRQQ